MYPKLYKRNSIYYFKYTDPATKKRKQISTQEKRYRAAQKKMITFIDRKSGGGDISYRSYADPFTSYTTSPRVRRLTSEGKSIGKKHVEQQSRLLASHIFPDQISAMPIAEITAGDVIDFRNRIYHRLAGRPNTANKVFNTFKVVLSEAALRMDIPVNPAAGIGGIKFQAGKKEILTREQITELFSDQDNFPSILAYQVFRFAAFTGMRSSEILALHWEQLGQGVLTVDRAWKTIDELGPPKSGKVRVVPLAPSVLECLPKRKGKLVFSQNGKRLGKTWWLKNWRKILLDGEKMEDLPYRPHSLRHALNTHLIAAGAPLQYIQIYLGWSQTGLTQVQRNYTHITPEHLRTVSNTIDQIYQYNDNEIPFQKKA